MSDNVHRLPAPDVQLIDLAFALFGNAMRGQIELAWTDSVEPFRLRNAQMFDLSEWDDLVERASRLNARPNVNVYFSLGLRRGDMGHQRASDGDVVAVVGLKADFDRQGAAEKAREALDAAGLTPSFWVYTGEQPFLRAHAYWLLEEPTDQMARVEQIERWIAQALRADTAITNRSRIMRLPGSVAWPLKAGRVVEMTGWLGGDEWPTRAVPYSLDEIESCVRRAGWAKEPESNIAVFTGFLDLNDAPEQPKTPEQRLAEAEEPGRWHDSVLRAIGQLLRIGTPPEIVVELLPWRVVQPGFTVEQTRDEVRVMVQGAVAKGFYRPAAPDLTSQPTNPAAAPSSRFLRHAEFINLPPPQWLVPDVLVAADVNLIYGPPGCFKTFSVIDLALCVANGVGWHGRTPCAPMPVLYICGEGSSGFGKRVLAWEAAHNRRAVTDNLVMFNGAPNLSDQNVARMFAEEVMKLPEAERGFGLVVIDTVFRTFGSGTVKDDDAVSAYFRNVEALKARLGNPAVLLVHHSGKDRERGFNGSMVFSGNSAVVVRLERPEDRGELAVTFVAEKVKDGEEAQVVATLQRREVVHPHTGEMLRTLVVVDAEKRGQDDEDAPRVAQEPNSMSMRLQIIRALQSRPMRFSEIMELVGGEKRKRQLSRGLNALEGLGRIRSDGGRYVLADPGGFGGSLEGEGHPEGTGRD